jgi:hypothetical protein
MPSTDGTRRSYKRRAVVYVSSQAVVESRFGNVIRRKALVGEEVVVMRDWLQRNPQAWHGWPSWRCVDRGEIDAAWERLRRHALPDRVVQAFGKTTVKLPSHPGSLRVYLVRVAEDVIAELRLLRRHHYRRRVNYGEDSGD